MTSFLAIAAGVSRAAWFAGLLAVLAAPVVQAQIDPRPPGSVIRDCDSCPEMIVLPPGKYVMGSTERERRTLGVMAMFDRMESPRHPVHIDEPFAVGRYAVTFEQWDACVADGGCAGYRPDDSGWGRGRRPVIQVNWADAQSYIDWLKRKTGQSYRLLSEAEWEYAARAGMETYYFYGSKPDHGRANFGNHRDRTLEVGSFAPNAFGLYDMSGNAAQWVQDCHHESYEGAPADGSAWLTGNCTLRNVRGGAWSLSGWSVRTAQRIGDPIAQRNSHLGFRVARDLP